MITVLIFCLFIWRRRRYSLVRISVGVSYNTIFNIITKQFDYFLMYVNIMFFFSDVLLAVRLRRSATPRACGARSVVPAARPLVPNSPTEIATHLQRRV